MKVNAPLPPQFFSLSALCDLHRPTAATTQGIGPPMWPTFSATNTVHDFVYRSLDCPSPVVASSKVTVSMRVLTWPCTSGRVCRSRGPSQAQVGHHTVFYGSRWERISHRIVKIAKQVNWRVAALNWRHAGFVVRGHLSVMCRWISETAKWATCICI